MADFLDEKRREMQGRLNELKPLVEEAQRLEAALQALDGVGTQPSRKSGARRGRSNGSATNGAGKRGRPKGSGTRSKQALGLVTSRPGITISEIAQAMDIQQNYLYRVLSTLQKEGLVRKEGQGWHPMDAA